MIPLRLALTNFLAYRNPAPLDFAGLHVAVLCGENGAGKSSLLDAVTWALWGRARAKTDAELVHAGESEMMVDFAFRLGEVEYRVQRRKKAKGTALLDFQGRPVGGKWNALAEATVLKTQQKINSALRMDYETFIHSAYLMQGRADEFTSKSPTKRKEVLADILQLQRWEVFEDRAKAKVAFIEKRLEALGLMIKEYDAELARRPLYLQELASAQAKVIEVNERLRQAEAGWAEIDAARQAMLTLDRQIDDLTRRLRENERELALLDTEIQTAAQKADVTHIERELRLAQNRLEELAQREADYTQLAEARQRTSELAAGLTEQNKATQDQANDLKKRIELLRAEGDRAAKQWQTALHDIEHTSRQQTDALKADFDRLKRKRHAEVETEAKRAHTRITTLRDAAEPRCPTCGQALDDSARTQLITDLEAELAERRTQVEQTLHDEAQIVEARILEISVAAREKHQTLLTTQNTEFETRQAQAAELETQVEARREQYRQNLAQLKRYTEEQARYDKDLALLETQLRDRAAIMQRVAEWQTALMHADEARARLTTLQERRQRWQTTLTADRAARAQLEKDATQYTAILRDSAARQRALDQLRHEDTLTKAHLGAAQQKLAALEALAEQRTARRAEEAEQKATASLYSELRDAFSKKGIPALMIAAAVPEIETAANTLLGRMTGGRMHVRFETQRETQAGDTRETLDIQISDELGTRAYEMYSGGEAFRVNFAIRVALSQMLARRAGTQLQTLIVDEGFGALDAQGREHLVDAIHHIQDDFKCILVVTHIEELKDAFPARIEVTKRAEGSEIVVR